MPAEFCGFYQHLIAFFQTFILLFVPQGVRTMQDLELLMTHRPTINIITS